MTSTAAPSSSATMAASSGASGDGGSASDGMQMSNDHYPGQDHSESQAGSWQPQEHELSQVLELLRESQSPDTQIQRQVQQVRFYRVVINFLSIVTLQINEVSLIFSVFSEARAAQQI